MMYGKTEAEIWEALQLVEKLKERKTRFKLFINYDEYKKFGQWNNERNVKMTREEAIAKFHNIMYPDTAYIAYDDIKSSKWDDDRKWSTKAISVYEALGLLKFEKKEEPYKLCSYEGGNDKLNVRIEKWPEGLVLWVDGKIVWKSWMQP